MAVRVSADSFQAEVLDAQGVVIADFYSDSCIPCKRMSPLLAEIEEEQTEIKLVKVNINYESDLVERYEVQAAPTLIFFKDGKEADRIRGAARKADITEIIEKLK